jgi:hypothetical protein
VIEFGRTPYLRKIDVKSGEILAEKSQATNVLFSILYNGVCFRTAT